MNGAVAESVVRHLSVIDPRGNPGGGMRFVRALLPALRRMRPELEIRFFGTPSRIAREDTARELSDAGVDVRELEWTAERSWKSRPLRTRVAYKVRRKVGLEPARLEDYVAANLAHEIDGADVTYFPWPYGMSPPALRSAVVSTIHDLNFKYFFGAPIFGHRDVERLDAEIWEWVRRSKVIVSSQFMADELAHFYPAAGAVPVIRLAPFVHAGRAERGPGTLGPHLPVARPFVLCPTQVTAHKNVGVLIAAQARLRERFPDLKLVLTGTGTEMATGQSSAIGSVRWEGEPDVIGLGYVSNEQIDRLIEEADVVVNPSLYEAGNGPGLDAWSLGTPVAMSDIPSFREHLVTYDVQAALFDARDPADIASKIAGILAHRDAWAQAAGRSKTAIGSRTWDDVAADYLAAFDAAANATANV